MKHKIPQHAVDKRSRKDRRCWQCRFEFPYIDSHGTLVTEERRKEQRRDAILAEIKTAKVS